MPSIRRPLSGDVLLFDLREEQRHASDRAILARSGRNARTLVKDGPLRVTLVVLAPGGELAEHQADGPITVQPVAGRIRFTADGVTHELEPGEMLSAGAGVRHAVASTDGATFLLTVALPAGGTAGA
jgi:quercetin dioxygenase-like cupin family protein